MIITGTYHAYCESVLGGGCDVTLKFDFGTDNWGDTVDSTEADYTSTNTYEASTISVTSTGWKTWSIPGSIVDLIIANNTLWYRLNDDDEETQVTKRVTFYTQDAAAEYRPYLRLENRELYPYWWFKR